MSDKAPLNLVELIPEVSAIQSADLRSMVEEIWNALWADSLYEDVMDVPVSATIDYPQVKHCQGIVRSALAAASAFEQVHDVTFDRDLLIAGALLMDVGKLVEIKPGPSGPARTEIGRLLPHAAYVAHVALAKGAPLELVHIIMCHSPNGGKAPETLECKLLDSLDQADIGVFGFDIWSRKVVHFQPGGKR